MEQSKVDELFGYKLNDTPLEGWMLEDLKYIQHYLKDKENINLSISETLYFWLWRSELYDASFLAVSQDGKSDPEIISYFNEFVEQWFKD